MSLHPSYEASSAAIQPNASYAENEIHKENHCDPGVVKPTNSPSHNICHEVDQVMRNKRGD